MCDIIDFAIRELQKNKDKAYGDFSRKLTPTKMEILGVRVPVLRKIAKEIAKGDHETFLKKFSFEYMEDAMLFGLVIGYLKLPYDKMYKIVANFVPKIDNWAVCDSFCSGLKFFKKDGNNAIEFLKPYLKSDEEFRFRFAIVSLLFHFIEPSYIDFVLNTCFNSSPKQYYAKMAVSWAISVCYVKFPDKTLPCFNNCLLDDFTYNKAISKICDSFRVEYADKEKLKRLRRASKR